MALSAAALCPCPFLWCCCVVEGILAAWGAVGREERQCASREGGGSVRSLRSARNALNQGGGSVRSLRWEVSVSRRCVLRLAPIRASRGNLWAQVSPGTVPDPRRLRETQRLWESASGGLTSPSSGVLAGSGRLRGSGRLTYLWETDRRGPR
jgi:hypothetical protein